MHQYNQKWVLRFQGGATFENDAMYQMVLKAKSVWPIRSIPILVYSHLCHFVIVDTPSMYPVVDIQHSAFVSEFSVLRFELLTRIFWLTTCSWGKFRDCGTVLGGFHEHGSQPRAAAADLVCQRHWDKVFRTSPNRRFFSLPRNGIWYDDHGWSNMGNRLCFHRPRTLGIVHCRAICGFRYLWCLDHTGAAATSQSQPGTEAQNS